MIKFGRLKFFKNKTLDKNLKNLENIDKNKVLKFMFLVDNFLKI